MFSSVFSGVLDAFSHDVAIDLGTANTLIYLRGKGVVCSEPSVVAVHQNRRGDREVIAVGTRAKEMLGRTPGDILAIRPLRDGVIADFDVAEAMLRHFIQQACGRSRLFQPRAVVSIPYGTTEVEKRAVRESAESAGAREVHLLEEPLAAAMGAELDVTEAHGNMIVDVGGGTTEVAVISLGGVVYSRSIKVGGDAMDEAIVQYLKRHRGLLVGPRTAEEVKISIGTAVRGRNQREMGVKGRDLATGFPTLITVTSDEVQRALEESVQLIVDTVIRALERTPPELASDIVDRGLVMTGGGALLKDLDRCLRDATGLPVIVADNPLDAVVIGSGRALEQRDLLRALSA
jgi:rod shape-determining protein MreB